MVGVVGSSPIAPTKFGIVPPRQALLFRRACFFVWFTGQASLWGVLVVVRGLKAERVGLETFTAIAVQLPRLPSRKIPILNMRDNPRRSFTASNSRESGQSFPMGYPVGQRIRRSVPRLTGAWDPAPIYRLRGSLQSSGVGPAAPVAGCSGNGVDAVLGLCCGGGSFKSQTIPNMCNSRRIR